MDRGRGDVLGVLTYHRIGDVDTVAGHPGLVSASASQFAEQMDFVRRRFRAVALHDVLEARENGRSLGPRAVLVTFDDAYRDFAEHAWPVLRSRGMPVTLFVPTAFPGSPDRGFWWDWLHEAVMAAPDGAEVRMPSTTVRLASRQHRANLLRQLRAELKREPHETLLAVVADVGEQLGSSAPAGQVLDWSELRSLADEGVALAPHSRSHPLLDRIATAELDVELSGSLADLEEHIGPTPKAFAYPSGAHSDRRARGRRGRGLLHRLHDAPRAEPAGTNRLARDAPDQRRTVVVSERAEHPARALGPRVVEMREGIFWGAVAVMGYTYVASDPGDSARSTRAATRSVAPDHPFGDPHRRGSQRGGRDRSQAGEPRAVGLSAGPAGDPDRVGRVRRSDR